MLGKAAEPYGLLIAISLVRSGLQTRGLRIAHDFVLRFVKPDDLERWKLCMAVIVKVVDALKLFVRFVLPRRSF